MKIVLAEGLNVPEQMIDALAEKLTARGHSFVRFAGKPANAREMAERIGDADAAIIANSPFPDDAVRACGNLKMLSVAFAGVDHVGKAACREKNIPVCNAAGYSNETVAELVIGQTLSLLRMTREADAATRAGKTSLGLMGGEIAGRTVGIIGTGRIGLRTAQLFQAFGAEVIAFSRTEKAEAVQMGIRYLPLDEVMAKSDIISLHVPLKEDTRGLIGEREIALMKETAVLVNCARGPVVQAGALADALNSGRIAGAAIDVFDKEPPLDESEPLLSAKNCILTPHTGFLTKEAMARRAQIVFDNIAAWLEGKELNKCAL